MTLVINYCGERLCYRVVGWPGFIGALSGVAPGRFAVSLNAVLRVEAAEWAKPITLLLRRVLESAADFSEALEVLASPQIACDCLLLVTGIRPGEMVVIFSLYPNLEPLLVHQEVS